MRIDHLRPFVILIGLGVAYAALFYLHPELDLTLAHHFYDKGFFLQQEPYVQISFRSIPWITRVVIAGSLTILFWQGARYRRLNRPALFIILSLALGPGLLVHTVFKDNWGRARPSQIVEFGGTKQFSAPFVISDQCAKNCSFVSGHVALAFFLAAFALLFTGAKRIVLYSLAIAFGLWIGFVRMAMGGHFFSDVIFAGIFTLFVVHLVYYFLLVKPCRT